MLKDIILMEVGKIIIAGATAAGAIALSEIIEKALLTVPGFGFNIPILGSLASIVGLFLGAVVSGIIGAIALHMIDNAIAEAKLRESRAQVITQGNAVLAKQNALIATDSVEIARQKGKANANITLRHASINDALHLKRSAGEQDTDAIHQHNDDMLTDIINKLNS